MKLKVFGAGNEKDYTFVIFSKDPDFFKSFGDLTKKAFGHTCYSHEIEKEAGAAKMKVKKVSDYTDRHEACYDESHSIRFDLFFGCKRVFVMIHGSKKSKDRFSGVLAKSATFVKR
jgi:hypothetical protein